MTKHKMKWFKGKTLGYKYGKRLREWHVSAVVLY